MWAEPLVSSTFDGGADFSVQLLQNSRRHTYFVQIKGRLENITKIKTED